MKVDLHGRCIEEQFVTRWQKLLTGLQRFAHKNSDSPKLGAFYLAYADSRKISIASLIT